MNGKRLIQKMCIEGIETDEILDFMSGEMPSSVVRFLVSGNYHIECARDLLLDTFKNDCIHDYNNTLSITSKLFAQAATEAEVIATTASRSRLKSNIHRAMGDVALSVAVEAYYRLDRNQDIDGLVNNALRDILIKRRENELKDKQSLALVPVSTVH